LQVATFRDRELEPGLVRLVSQELDLGRQRHAIFELDPAPPSVDFLGLHHALELHDIRFGGGAARVQKRFGELPVIGGQENAARVEVESPDRIHPARHCGEQLADARATFRVLHGGDDTARLVQDHVNRRFANDARPVDFDPAVARIDLRSELRHDLSVHAHTTGGDEPFGRTAGRHARMSQYLLQADRGHAGRDSVDRLGMRRVDKPWGHEMIWAQTDRYVGKIIHIRAGHKLSRQYHVAKDETFLVESGEMDLEVGDGAERRVIRMAARDTFHCAPRTIHRMVAVTDVDVIEVSTPELDDVVRLEDAYGRQGTSEP
jgi:mannose-6-phosphate isomerase-like protein (cupin superfamily)